MSVDPSILEQLRKAREKKVKAPYKGIQKVSKKTAARRAEEKKNADPDESLNAWFLERRKDMTGICDHCGGPSCRDDNDWFRSSIAHILPKRFFKSVATHPCNWIELCFWGNNCHGNLDNNILDLTELNCFDKVIDAFLAMYPDIAKEERKRIPATLMQYIADNLLNYTIGED